MFADAFLGSGVPVAGDPITSFQTVPLLGLRTATILHNSRPTVRDVVKVRFLATNSGERRLQLVRSLPDGQERNDEDSERDAITLLPGESTEFSTFRSWDAPGEHQLTLGYEARCAGLPFARLTYPTVAVRVIAPEANALVEWTWSIWKARPQGWSSAARIRAD